MRELQLLLEKYHSLREKTDQLVLATVIHVAGSSYRRAGARMLIDASGNWTGGVSGGCLEGDLLKRAQGVFLSGNKEVVSYDTRDDDPHQIGVGLGCKGLIDILLELIDCNNSDNYFELLAKGNPERKTQIITHTLDNRVISQNLDKLCFEHGSFETTRISEDPGLDKTLKASMVEALQAGQSQLVELSNSSDTFKLFIEILTPKRLIYICGHEYDTIPLMEICRKLNWEIHLVCKPTKINKQQYQLADKIIDNKDPSALSFAEDRHTALITMNHDYATDKAILRQAQNTALPYIGILGPQSRGEKMLKELNITDAALLERLHYPVGLDLGAEEPEEVAISIVSEIIAVQYGRQGGSLKFRQAPIHDRT